MDKFPKKILFFVLAFFVLIGVAAGSYFVYNNVPTIESALGWKDSLYWMQNNLPKNAKIFNWWDEGHWISFIGEKKVISDNRTLDVNSTRDYGLFLISENEEEAYNIVKKYQSEYVVIKETSISSLPSMLIYIYREEFNPSQNKYLSVVFKCNSRIINLNSGEKEFACGSNVLNQTLMNSLPSAWIEKSNSVQQFGPAYLYKSKDYSKFFIFNPETNKTMIAKLLIDDSNLKHFKKIYQNGDVYIFEVVD